ncbi:phytanoyl-CoA dioxygenase [Eremomyces bilateralis CBS 781.70]|uniref:Phytanoyl-CoA dioxygenase n=1 Tax=Eremomyces bilateralis CBS 781.70 TaxID=1392243 RepID=A0A6G1GAG2_9PEZI|nr:phytanoyl-CoA dioxygenase [Eremomyces bilateralis CBS 781.70]KAF1814926.1 phytanoyl-CoA dioxygenase [Eremomyces bilateralis CBS 781.70]
MSQPPPPALLFPSQEKTLPANPRLRANIEHVLEHGYVILENVFTKSQAEEAKAEISRLGGNAPKVGRTAFEGLNTNRIYSLLNKTRVFDKFCTLPDVLALNDYFLEPQSQLHVLHTIQINPREEAQALHHDDAFINVPRPRPPFGTAIIVAFDDFTPTNGATRIIPKSHTWPQGRRPREEETQPAVCPAGSVVYFTSLLWHGGGANQTDLPRKSMTVQYCQPYIRPIENMVLSVDPRRLPEIPERIVEMMGYAIHKPFIGYADGLEPLKGADRMVNWLQRPLDPSPPTFADWKGKATARKGDEGIKSKI